MDNEVEDTARANLPKGIIERSHRIWNGIPSIWKYVTGLYLVAKVALTLTSVLAINAFDAFLRSIPAQDLHTNTDTAQMAISSQKWYSMWFAWDSLLYERMTRAEPGFDWDLQFGFPPLYSLMGRLLAIPLGGNTFLALLLISNVSFVLSLYFGYRLAERILGDEDSARRFTKYIVLMPTAFLFQAALTESLFLCLVLACFYYAERRKWLLVGLLGFLMALSRSVGFMLVIPLALVLLQQGQYSLRPRALLGYVKAGYPLLLVPAGWLSFMGYCRWQTGDWYRYKHVQEEGYSIETQNPLRTIWDGITTAEPPDKVRIWLVVVVLVITLIALKYVKPAYVVCGLVLVMVPLGIGVQGYRSLLRYMAVVFPVCLVFAVWGKRALVDMCLSTCLALLQGVLWVVWLAYWSGFIV